MPTDSASREQLFIGMQRVRSRLRRSRRTQYRSAPAREWQKQERRTFGMDMPRKQLVAEALIDLHRRLSTLATRSHERRIIMQETANLYGVSDGTPRNWIGACANGSRQQTTFGGWTRRSKHRDGIDSFCWCCCFLRYSFFVRNGPKERCSSLGRDLKLGSDLPPKNLRRLLLSWTSEWHPLVCEVRTNQSR